MTADVIDLNRRLNMRAHSPMRVRQMAYEAWRDFIAAHIEFASNPTCPGAGPRAVAAYNRWIVLECAGNGDDPDARSLTDLIDDDPGAA